MTAREDQIRTLVAHEAADWFVANREGLSVADAERFAAWLKVSPTNVQEYLEIARTAHELQQAGPDPAMSIEALVARARPEEGTAVGAVTADVQPWLRAAPATARSWRWAAACAAVLGAVGLGAVLWQYWQARGAPASLNATVLLLETRHGEQLTRRLPDESVLHLNTDSAAEVRYGASERRVTVRRGQADFEVVHNARRPFRVLAGAADIVDVGTNFDVYLQGDSTLVTVIEGKVEVGLAAPAAGWQPGAERAGPTRVPVSANQQLLVSSDALPVAPSAVNAREATSWLRHEIVFDHEPLETVAAEFNRYSPKPIEIGTPALKSLRISGVFATDDPQAFIAFLRSLKNVRVEETPTRIRVLRP